MAAIIIMATKYNQSQMHFYVKIIKVTKQNVCNDTKSKNTFTGIGFVLFSVSEQIFVEWQIFHQHFEKVLNIIEPRYKFLNNY